MLDRKDLQAGPEIQAPRDSPAKLGSLENPVLQVKGVNLDFQGKQVNLASVVLPESVVLQDRLENPDLPDQKELSDPEGSLAHRDL